MDVALYKNKIHYYKSTDLVIGESCQRGDVMQQVGEEADVLMLWWQMSRKHSMLDGVQHSTAQHSTAHHITSHHITSHHITSHHITSQHITSHHINNNRNFLTEIEGIKDKTSQFRPPEYFSSELNVRFCVPATPKLV